MSIPGPPQPFPSPKTHILQTGKKLIRFYDPQRQSWNAGRFYGPLKDLRFDHHPLPTATHIHESVWYASATLIGAVAESFGRIGGSGILDRNCGKRVCVAELSHPFKLADLCGTGPRHMGLDHQICTTREYDRTQEWARAIYFNQPDIVGIRWSGREVGSENVVLTERADLTTLTLLLDKDISDAAVWPRIANAARKCRIKII
jgi:hypothetical protein